MQSSNTGRESAKNNREMQRFENFNSSPSASASPSAVTGTDYHNKSSDDAASNVVKKASSRLREHELRSQRNVYWNRALVNCCGLFAMYLLVDRWQWDRILAGFIRVMFVLISGGGPTASAVKMSTIVQGVGYLVAAARLVLWWNILLSSWHLLVRTDNHPKASPFESSVLDRRSLTSAAATPVRSDKSQQLSTPSTSARKNILPREAVHTFTGPKHSQQQKTPSGQHTLSPSVSRSNSRSGFHQHSPIAAAPPGLASYPVSPAISMPKTPVSSVPLSSRHSTPWSATIVTPRPFNHQTPIMANSQGVSANQTPASAKTGRHSLGGSEYSSSIDHLFHMEREREMISKLTKTPPASRTAAGPATTIAGIGGKTATTPVFQPASRSVPEYAMLGKRNRQDHTAADSPSSGITTHISFEEVIAKLGVESSYLDLTKSLRSWFHSHVLKHVHDQITEVDDFLTKEGAGYLTTRRMTLMGPVVEQPGDLMSSPTHPSSQIPMSTASSGQMMTLQEAANRSPHPIMKQRLSLEQYLMVPRTPLSRTYIVDRIEALVRDSDIGSYSYDDGMQWRGQRWSSELPSDAEIVFHLFSAFMDDKMKSLGVYTTQPQPFTQTYIINTSASNTSTIATTADPQQSTAVRIMICQRYPLKLALAIGPNRVWDMHEGRNNLFYNILMFLKYLHCYHNGYLDTLDLNGRSLGLSSLLTPALKGK